MRYDYGQRDRPPVRLAYPLFNPEGTVNPIPGLMDGLSPFGGPQVWDAVQGRWRTRQRASFDGAWRWLRSDLGSFLTIYNKRLHPQAYTDITDQEIDSTPVDAEFVLQCAQARVMIEHNFFESRDWLRQELARKVEQARSDIKEKSYGFKK